MEEVGGGKKRWFGNQLTENRPHKKRWCENKGDKKMTVTKELSSKEGGGKSVLKSWETKP